MVDFYRFRSSPLGRIYLDYVKSRLTLGSVHRQPKRRGFNDFFLLISRYKFLCFGKSIGLAELDINKTMYFLFAAITSISPKRQE